MMSEKIQEHVRRIVALATGLNGFEAADAERLSSHHDFFLGLRDEIVTSFYDRLFGRTETAAVFASGERAAREKTLADWLERTITGPIDDSYWRWQWLVGLVHIKRKVPNPMMIAMMGHVSDLVLTRAVAELGADEGLALYRSFQRVATIVSALIAEGYTIGSLEAVSRATGMSTELISVHIHSVIEEQLADAELRVA
jgi:hypothetical protein